MINSVKLTRNIALSRSSPMGHFLSGRGSTAWETSIKSRVEVVQDEVPAGWRIMEKEKEEKVEEKTKRSGGLLANLWNRRASSIPRQDSKVAQDTSSKSESPVDTARSSMESVKSPASSTAAAASKVSSPTTLSPSSASPSASTHPAQPIESSPASTYADAGLPSFEPFSPTLQDKTPEAPPTPSAVTRFFNRFSRRSSTPSPHNSMMLSGDDLEFLSDMVPSASDGDADDDHFGGSDPHLKALENMLASKPIGGKLPAPLPPPPPAPSRTISSLSSNTAGQKLKANGPASLSIDVLVPSAPGSRGSSPSSSNPPPSIPSHSSTIAHMAPSSRPLSPAQQPHSTSVHPRPTHSSRNSRSSLSSVYPSPTADLTPNPATSFAISELSQANSQPVSRPMSSASIAASSAVAGMVPSPLSSAPHSRSQSPAFFPPPPSSTAAQTSVLPSSSKASPSPLQTQPMSAAAVVQNPPSLSSPLASQSQSQFSAPAKTILDDDDDFGDFADFGSSSQSPLAQSSSTFFDDSGFGSPATTAKPTQTSFTFPTRSAFSSSSHAQKPSTTSVVSSSSSTAWLGRPHAESVTSSGTDIVSHKSLDSFDDEFSSFMGTSARPKSPPHVQRTQAKSPLSTQPVKPMIPLISLGQPLKRPPSTSRSSPISPSVSAPALSISINPPFNRSRSLNRPLSSRTSPIDIHNRNTPGSSSASPIDPHESDIIPGNPISASSSYSSQTMSAGRKITRAENHQRTTSLMELAASRPSRWPAPISPLPEILSPPPSSNSGAGLVETDLLGDGDGMGVPDGVNSVQGSRFARMQTASSASQSTGLGLLGGMDDNDWLGATNNDVGNGHSNKTPSISPPPAPIPRPPVRVPLSTQSPPFIPAPPLLPPPPRPVSSSSLVGPRGSDGGQGGQGGGSLARGRPPVASNGVGALASPVASPRTPTLSPDSTPLAMLVSGGGNEDPDAVVNGGGFGSSRSPPPLSPPPPTNGTLLGSGLWGGNGIQTTVPTIPMPVKARPTPPPPAMNPVTVVPPVSNAKGAGGLSAQDLSFFEGL